MRVLVFGDSITQGFWDAEGGWVSRLRRHYDGLQLQNLANNDEPTIFNLGISGDVTKGVIMRLDHEVEARKWRWPTEKFVLIFAIGINDTAINEGVEVSTAQEYGQQLKTLISKAKTLSNRIMFIGLTPVEEDKANGRPGKPKEYSNKRIASFDNIIQQICSIEKITYVYLAGTLGSKIEEGQRLFDDGLHPNDQGHQLIFELVRPELDKLLAS